MFVMVQIFELVSVLFDVFVVVLVLIVLFEVVLIECGCYLVVVFDCIVCYIVLCGKFMVGGLVIVLLVGEIIVINIMFFKLYGIGNYSEV